MNEERIQARIAELEGERDDFIKEANLTVNTRVGAYNGAIAELKRLLDKAPARSMASYYVKNGGDDDASRNL